MNAFIFFYLIFQNNRPAVNSFSDQYAIYLVSFVLPFLFLSWLARVTENLVINTVKKQQLEKQAVEAELYYLKSQINPHFLFNTLNNIYGLSLQQSDKALAEASASVRETEQQRQQLITREQQLLKQKTELEQSLQQQQKLLASQLKSAYSLGQHDYSRMLLNQQDASKLERVLSYYQYFNRARIKQLAELNHTISQLQQVLAQLTQQQQQLASTLETLQLQQKQLANAAGVVEVHRTVMKLFGRRKKSIISHLFAHDRPTWLDGV